MLSSMDEFSMKMELERALEDSMRYVGDEFFRKLSDYIMRYPESASNIKFAARLIISNSVSKLNDRLTIRAC
jgi:hypothetical protein